MPDWRRLPAPEDRTGRKFQFITNPQPFSRRQETQGGDAVNGSEERLLVDGEAADPANYGSSQQDQAPTLAPCKKRKCELPGEEDVLGQTEKEKLPIGVDRLRLKAFQSRLEGRMQGIPESDAGPPTSNLQ